MKNLFYMSGIVLFLFFFADAEGKIIHVPGDQPTIQSGIQEAVDGDTVLVDEGVYYENIRFGGKSIVVASKYILENNTDYILNTIIDGSRPIDPNEGSCVMLIDGEDSSAVIQGFTLRNGTGWFVVVNGVDSREGGGIMLVGSSATIKNNLIINNCAIKGEDVKIGGGGGISALWDGNPTIGNNVVMLNRANYGAGMAFSYSGATVRNNIIFRNYDTDKGGGAGLLIIYADPHEGIFENNTIVGNISKSRTGGISSSTKNTISIIRNNIIWGNRQNSGKQVEEHTLWNPVSSFNNVSFRYNNNEDSYTGTGNFTSYPDFSDNLFSLNENSKCIDTGDTNSIYNDIECILNTGHAESPSLGGLRNDIGAYGGPCAKALPNFYYEELNVPDKITFPGNVKVNVGSTISLEIINLSTTVMRVDSIVIVGSDELYLNPGFYSGTLKPIQTDTLEIEWKPKQTGNLSATLKIFHNLSGFTNPVIVKVNGTAAAVTGISDGQSSGISIKFELHQNFPNPFNPTTHIKYSIPNNEFVSLKIFDILGRNIKTLVNEFQQPGNYEVVLDGAYLASGLYFYYLKAGPFSDMKKLVLLK